MRKLTALLAAICLGLPIGAASVSASTVTFDNRADFLASSGEATDRPNPTFGFTRGAVNFSGVTLQAAPGSNVGSNNGFSTLIQNEIAQSGVENFNVSFSETVFGFGFDVLDPLQSTAALDGCNVSTCFDSTFSVALFSAGSLIDTVSFNPDTDVLAFFGVLSTVGFDSVQVRETFGTDDNEFFGNFVTTAAPVPLPPALAMFLGAVGVLGLVARRRAA